MILKNLLRRKGRTLLTMLGISVGVAAIIALGAMADGLEGGYASVLGGSQADFVLSDPEAYDIILSAVDEDIGPALEAMPEVEAVSGLLQGLVRTEDTPYFFVFAYTDGSFSLERFNVVEGVPLDAPEADEAQGKPVLLGSAAAEAYSKDVGDTIRIGDAAFRIVGIYETGESFEEGGAVLRLADAQALLGMQRQVSAYYIRLEDTGESDRLRNRVERQYADLSLSTTSDFADRNTMGESVTAMVWGVAALAILIGGISMTNAQLMAVLERTREIGVLRAVGWRRGRIIRMILGESLLVSLLGGGLGVLIGWGLLAVFSSAITAFGATTQLKPDLLAQAGVVVVGLGLTGGLYPAYRASLLQPVEALRYEGGTMGKQSARLPVGGMALQNLWRRRGRTLLTLAVIGLTVGAIMVLDSVLSGMSGMMTDMLSGGEIVLRQADAADLSLSAIDERIGARIEAMPEVRSVSGATVTAIMSEDMGIFVMLGYAPREAAIQEFNVVEGEPISGNRQIMLGRQMSEAQNVSVGDTVTLGDTRYRVTGIYEHNLAFYEMGGVVSLRDAQNYMGRPRKVTLFLVGLNDPAQAEAVAAEINAAYPEVHASLSGSFAEQLPDLQNVEAMSGGISLMAILVGGVGVMNTMLMAVLERTREIGTLRALGWRRRRVLGLIMREALALGLLGGVSGIAIALALAAGLGLIPTYGNLLEFHWGAEPIARAIAVAVALGVVGGLYPALRATRLQPVEALRYE